MRKFSKNTDLSVQVFAGTHVALMGMNVSQSGRKGLLGFKIEKKRPTAKTYKTLRGGARYFKNLDAVTASGKTSFIIQSMMWADYTLAPGTAYTFRVTPIYGTPNNMQEGKAVSVDISTEKQDNEKHGVFFNRGVAASASYTRRFGKYLRYYPEKIRTRNGPKLISKPYIKPEDVPDRAAYKWLSRGLEEGLLKFLAQAKDEGWAIRACVYEFSYKPAIQGFIDALDRGADVKIIHHHKMASEYKLKYQRGSDLINTSYFGDGSQEDIVFKNRYGLKVRVPDSVAKTANKTVSEMGSITRREFDDLNSMMIGRENTAISHNKFILLLKDGQPKQVWTGSTNFTGGGIFGQSNVGHIVRDDDVAAAYLEFWNMLKDDPKSGKGKAENLIRTPNITGEAPEGITPIFSPRPDEDILNWYASRISAAKSSVFLTTAFTVSKPFIEALQLDGTRAEGDPFARYVLMESNTGLLKDKIPLMESCPDNILAWGEVKKKRTALEKEHGSIETLTGLNTHVNFLHTKYMLIDPLSDDPLVISGSANFSSASTTKNDENMLIIRGNTRVADIFVTEFMRLFNHYQSRNNINRMSDEEFEASKFLTSDDSWTNSYYKAGSAEYNERVLFAGQGRDL
ncbi:phospholipase D-like domain-containing protein [Hellea sp.]|nr:phospholipase D-like domain-containing protein [Hellea sp.]